MITWVVYDDGGMNDTAKRNVNGVLHITTEGVQGNQSKDKAMDIC
jgi:hypothetical protein